MTMQRIGAYPTVEEAIHAANNLELKGYKAANIVIFTNKRSQEDIKKYTDVNINHDITEQDENDSLIDKVKTLFTDSESDEEERSNYEKLVNLGFSEKQATKWTAELEAGSTMIFADDEIRMGHPISQPEIQ
ncbi:general stress protein [Virgibacillus sp. W0181]|uniref:general stress protein n=1 Tax=Virgibacillus sp. W0181 TaxID=3391581 RepID=UPI003F45B3C4